LASADPYLNKLLIKSPHGKANAKDVAQKLGMSQRTLARHLASEGLTFVEMLKELRIDLAKRDLADRDLSISQNAWLLGYKDISSFTHAFKRWTGDTPRTTRQAGLSGV
jgi:AraC-like DNA-binding protein